VFTGTDKLSDYTNFDGSQENTLERCH
jgi:hypothetical protein